MRKSTTPLTPAQVYRFAIDFCQPHLDFRGKGKVTATDPLDRPLRRRRADLLDLRDLPPPGRRPLRGDLRQGPLRQPLLPGGAQAQGQRLLPAHLPRALRRRRKRPLRVIVDLTLIPYYGQHPLDSLEIYRSKKKAGTRSFFAYATAYVLLHGQRFTLAVTPVTRSELLKDVLQELLHLVSKAGLRPACCSWTAASTTPRLSATCSRPGGRS